MAGRNHIPPHALKLGSRPLINDPRAAAAIHRAPPPSGQAPTSSARPHHIEEHILAQRRDMQALLLDNQRLAATHVALKQELAAAQRDLRHFSATAAAVQADSESQVRDVFEQSLKTEAEARSIAGLSIELGRVRDDIQKLSSDRNELTAKLQAINGDILRARSELHHLPAIQQEIEVMNREIQRGR
ncbi:hypothetical protein RJ640_025153 [Escallonia rubra]|uniref:Uncharacterized protein n=1 Tax=Escallonia rubra TaxID=112253 RepID=A0AA88R7T3_9ASTE|nr:hypothetical protein RJ640_025153 [Escallonia rubra]